MRTSEGLFAGGGELGSLMRGFDWSSTALGPVETWPQSLRTCVRIMLTSRQPIWLGWGEQLIYMYNDPYKAIIGGKHPDALGQPTSVVWREIWDVIAPMLAQAMQGTEGTYVEAQRLIMKRYGYDEETYYTFSYSPVPDDTGKPAGIICANTDDTRRVIGERQMALLRDLAARTSDARTLEAASQLAADALATNPFDIPFAALYLVDSERQVASRTAVVGIESEHPLFPRRIATSDDALWPVDKVVSTREMAVVPIPAGHGALPHGGWERESSMAAVLPITQTGERGQTGVLIAALNPYRLVDDNYAGFLRLVAGHVSASIGNAEAYQEERRRADELAALDRAKTAFFSNVSHEFRTPLTLLLGPAQDAIADPSTIPANRERLLLIHRNALRLLKLVNTLLDFSRIEAGRAQATYERTDLGAYTAELASNFRSATDRAGLALQVDVPSTAEDVYVDRDMWEKIVLNLLSNALKHTFQGHIRVTVQYRDGEAILEVRDTGVGIPDDQLPRIFERFHRVPNARSRTHEGTGIGLALVQELVKLHGGTMRVASTVGQGTTFTISIPVGTEHLDAERIAPSTERSSTSPGSVAYIEEALRWLPEPDVPAESASADELSRGSARLLVADDNADMRDYVVRLLRQRGWTVQGVANGIEALERLAAFEPDAVLTDVMMPGIDGFELIRRMRADDATRAIPVIMLSARAGEEARVEGIRAGADDYLVKPFAAQELVARVEAQLRRGEVISEERREKFEREQRMSVIDAERARLRELFTKSPAAIAVLRGPEHVFDVANPHYLELVGRRDLIGKPLREALPEVGDDIHRLLDDVYRTGVPFVAEQFGVPIDADGDGVAEEHFYNFVYQPIRDSDGSIGGVFVHVVEVTDLVRARRAAEDANRAKSEFLAAMSHELRTPLNAIAGHAQLMEMGVHGPVTPAQREALDRIQRSEAHLLALINDVLNFAKLEAGRVEYEVEDVELAPIVDDVLSIMEPHFSAKSLASSVQVDASAMVHADREKVRQILLNLLSNAVKFTPAGGSITVSTPRRASGSTPAGTVFLRVTDTGIGIPREKQEAIFDPFVQVHRELTRSTEGTGLGLAISRDLARGMGGELRVRSSESKGSAFTLTLPAVSR